jgi:glycerol uptake facilitator-like aquaporin
MSDRSRIVTTKTAGRVERPVELSRRVAAEAIGTAALLVVVVGSGIMAQGMFRDGAALGAGHALLANAIATGAGLAVLILMFESISGAHFNPVVTLLDAASGNRAWREVAPYVVAQIVGAIAGVLVTHVMFEHRVFEVSQHDRSGVALMFSEFVATFGLIAVIWGIARKRAHSVGPAVACYIVAAYWFTPSTSFANPAVTIARCLTDTFTGIRPSDVTGFIAAQFLGGAAAALLFRWLHKENPK